MLKALKAWIKEKKHPFYINQNRKYKHIAIGDYTFGKPSICGGENGQVTIGKFCSIAGGVSIYAGAEHRLDWVSQYSFNKFPIAAQKEIIRSKGKVSIGNDVWIGDGAFILSGVTIGDGAVIAARAVVVKDVKPYEIVGGNPAKHIRFRFSADQIEKLLAIAWWNWDIAKVEESFPLLLDSNIDAFIERYYKES